MQLATHWIEREETTSKTAPTPAPEEPPPRQATPPPYRPPGFYHGTSIAAALRLPNDTMSLILEHVLSPFQVGYYTPISDLKSLALSHSHFCDPVRAVLLRQPDVFDWVRVGTDHSKRLNALAASLEVNPLLGSWIHHLPHFGDLTRVLLGASVSPAVVAKTVLAILDKTPNLISLDLPSVELKDQVRRSRSRGGRVRANGIRFVGRARAGHYTDEELAQAQAR